MTLIEGVGDEVVQFVGVLLVLIVAALAWWSTNARPDRYHTVLVMRSRAHHPVTVSIRTRSNVPIASNSSGTSIEEASTSSATGHNAEADDDSPRDNARVIPLQEMDSIVDADMAMLDNNRLHFYRRIDSSPNNPSGSESTSDESEAQEEAEPASNAQIREMDSIVSAMEADVTAGCEFFRPSESSSSSVKVNKTASTDSAPSVSDVVTPSEDNPSETTEAETAGDTTDGNQRKILIKLKYLNDTLKEVEGSLDELLKDFKWRHFSSELAVESRVRLIFNGRVLADDDATLRACGLHHRAVVHCLVHPKRQTAQHRGLPEPPSNPQEMITGAAAAERPWDLENILMTLVSIALTVVWFFRCEYSNMFTASASVALFGLTVFYSVAIFGLYLSDTFHTDRRPQPVPNN